MKRLFKNLSLIEWGYKPSGFCPVQSEGYFMGYYFYFRGRYDNLSIDFAESHEDWWDDRILYEKVLKRTDGIFDAGYYPYDECMKLIIKGCFLFFIYQIFKIKL